MITKVVNWIELPAVCMLLVENSALKTFTPKTIMLG